MLKKDLLIFTDALLLLLFIFHYLIINGFNSAPSLASYKFSVVLLYFYCLVSLKSLGIGNYRPEILFLYMFFLFLIAKIALDIFFLHGSFGQINYFADISISYQGQARALQNLFLAILGFHIGVVIFDYINTQNLSFNQRLNFQQQYYRFGLIFMVIFFPITVKYYYDTALFVFSSGYLAYHSGEHETKSIIVFIAEQFFWVGYAFVMASIPKKSTFISVTLIFVVSLLLVMLFVGKRGYVMTTLVMVVWYMHLIYNFRVPKVVFFAAVGITIFLLSWIGSYRHGSVLEVTSLIGLIFQFLDGQGSSVNTLLYSVEYIEMPKFAEFSLKNLFADFFTLVDKLYRKLFGLDELTILERMEKFGYSGYIISNALPGDLLNSGASTGTSYLAEAFLLGREWMQFLLGIVVGFCVSMLNVTVNSRQNFLLVCIIFAEVIYLPRMSFSSIVIVNFLAIIIFLLYILIKKLQHQKQYH